MNTANVISLTPVLDLQGTWGGVWLHGDGGLDEVSQQFKARFPHQPLYLAGDESLAAGIQSAEQMTATKANGAKVFAGLFVTHPPVSAASKQDAGRVVLLRLLALVTQDADTAEIEQLFKREPGLSFYLFRLVNSPGMGLTSKITTFNQAIMVLGRRQLQRWVQLLLYASKQEDSGSPLLAFAAMRGYLLEQLAVLRGGDAILCEQAFMTGMFSLLDCLLGMSMAEITKSIRLPDAVQQALLDRQGELGKLLAWVDGIQAGSEAPPLAGISTEQCTDIQFDALAWALDVGAGLAQGADA